MSVYIHLKELFWYTGIFDMPQAEILLLAVDNYTNQDAYQLAPLFEQAEKNISNWKWLVTYSNCDTKRWYKL